MSLYSVFYTSAASRQFRQLPSSISPAIREAVEALARNPRTIHTQKLAGLPDAYRLRVGRYRVVYTIGDRLRRVVIHRIAHRREVYR